MTTRAQSKLSQARRVLRLVNAERARKTCGQVAQLLVNDSDAQMWRQARHACTAAAGECARVRDEIEGDLNASHFDYAFEVLRKFSAPASSSRVCVDATAQSHTNLCNMFIHRTFHPPWRTETKMIRESRAKGQAKSALREALSSIHIRLSKRLPHGAAAGRARQDPRYYPLRSTLPTPILIEVSLMSSDEGK